MLNANPNAEKASEQASLNSAQRNLKVAEQNSADLRARVARGDETVLPKDLIDAQTEIDFYRLALIAAETKAAEIEGKSQDLARVKRLRELEKELAKLPGTQLLREQIRMAMEKYCQDVCRYHTRLTAIVSELHENAYQEAQVVDMPVQTDGPVRIGSASRSSVDPKRSLEEVLNYIPFSEIAHNAFREGSLTALAD